MFSRTPCYIQLNMYVTGGIVHAVAADWRELARRLTEALHLNVAPIAITFSPVEGIPAFLDPSEPMPEATGDGRTGQVPAGCVFWVHALTRTFVTRPQDHGNCSVGSLTHGLIDLATAAGRADVKALVEAKWVTPDIFPGLPTVSSRPEAIAYGPLADATIEPDVVLLRTNARGVMTLGDALGDLSIEGKPQCHIVAIAKEQKRPAASVGCALSRARTGIGAHELTCALPGSRVAEIVLDLERAADIDSTVARYAAVDAKRFASLA